MKTVLKIIDYYINSSIHVSIATSALGLITYFFANEPVNYNVIAFIFSATFTSYNFIKYWPYVISHYQLKNTLKSIIFLVILALFYSIYLFFTFNIKAQIIIFFVSFLNVLYAIPITPHSNNFRNYGHIKIYIVSLCWAILTLLFPLYELNAEINIDVVIKLFQRFILTLSLILLFEINDLKLDPQHLKTVPQTLGINKTKYIVYLLGVVFYILDFLKIKNYQSQITINLILLAVLYTFTYFSNADKPRYYTLFGVESIPIIWYLLIIILE